MIFSYLFLLSLFISLINSNEQYHIGIINHNTQWYIHCLQNNTRLIKPPLNDQPLINYQCPYPSLSIDIIPIEIDFTFLCRLQPRLIWIIIDLYQYNIWLWSINIQQLNISLKLNQKINIKNFKNEKIINKNHLIIINAFYIPFELIEILLNKKIEIFIQINQCQFSINDNLLWNDVIEKNCTSIQSKTLHAYYGQCDFFPISMNTNYTETIDDHNTTHIPDFNVMLSIDKQQSIETTTTGINDYYLILNEHYENILSTLEIITKLSKLITYIFSFTIIIIILLIIFFIYILFYHYRIRSIKKSSLLI